MKNLKTNSKTEDRNMKTKPVAGWEERLNSLKKERHTYFGHEHLCVLVDDVKPLIKDIISNQRAQVLQEVRKRITRMKIKLGKDCNEFSHNGPYECCRNGTIDTILSSIDPEPNKPKEDLTEGVY